MRLANDEASGTSERSHKRRILRGNRCRDVALRPARQHGAQIILALVVLGQVATENRMLTNMRNLRTAGELADERHKKQKGADVGGNRIARHSEHLKLS